MKTETVYKKERNKKTIGTTKTGIKVYKDKTGLLTWHKRWIFLFKRK